MSFLVYPNSVLESGYGLEQYNTIMAQKYVVEYSNINFMIRNEGIVSIFNNQLNSQRPSLIKQNKMIGQHISLITGSLRTDALLNSCLGDFEQNLAPYAQVNFIESILSPTLPPTQKEDLSLSLVDCGKNLVSNSNSMTGTSMFTGFNMAYCTVFKGDVIPKYAQLGMHIYMFDKRFRRTYWN